MPDCTPSGSWGSTLTYVSPAVGALLTATAAWVVSRTRTTSGDEPSISQAAETCCEQPQKPRARNASRRSVPAQRK